MKAECTINTMSQVFLLHILKKEEENEDLLGRNKRSHLVAVGGPSCGGAPDVLRTGGVTACSHR